MISSPPVIDTTPTGCCIVCGGSAWREEGRAQDYEYETCSNWWAFQSCEACGHVQMDPLPAASALSTIYPPDYYSYVMDQSIHPLARWAKGLLDRRKFGSILSRLSRPARSYLDVGCGDGRYLQLMIDAGADRHRVHGVELDARAVDKARAAGLQVSHCRIEDARQLQPGSFDLITMFHVIEHVARPDEVVRRMHELLGSGGILALETPNFDCLDARLARRRYWGGYHAPRHWHLFTTRSLVRLLSDCGLVVERVSYQTGHAFLLWTLHHWLKYEKGWASLAKWSHPLRNIPLLAAATSFDLARIALGRRTSAMLILAKKA